MFFSLNPFMYIYVGNCEYLLTVWAQIYHSVTLFSLHYFLIFYFSYWKKQYSCYFYILHLSILAINKQWKWMFFCVLSTDKSPTPILPLFHVSYILYCSFASCGQLRFQNGRHLLPSSGTHSFFFLFLFIYLYFHTVVSVYIGEFSKGITHKINVWCGEVSN